MALPLCLDRLKDSVQVVLLKPVKDEQEALEVARRAPVLHVTGRHVLAWVRHLASVYPDVEVDDATVRLYENLNGPPEVLVQATIFPTTAEEAAELQRQYVGDRDGYAQTRHGSEEEAAAEDEADARAAGERTEAQLGRGAMAGLHDMELHIPQGGEAAVDGKAYSRCSKGRSGCRVRATGGCTSPMTQLAPLS